MGRFIIKDAKIVNGNQIFEGDVLINDTRIEKIDGQINIDYVDEVDADGLYLIPGVIDDQVHFREPGLTHKADIASESRAAVAGGTTSFMEMPNTKPQSTTQEKLQAKYSIADMVSPANYSFFMGATNDNLEEVLRTNPKDVCGVKIFMGSSTGNMLVDNEATLDQIFSNVEMLIATHCEDEESIRKNLEIAKEKYGTDIPFSEHPIIRDDKVCYLSSSKAIELAKKHDTRLHILHISTEKELSLFTNDLPLKKKRITAEVCVHHLYFNNSYYPSLGSKVKCNPAIKSAQDQSALLDALLDDRLDIIATDHAPHTIREKSGEYLQAPSGLPLVQHGLLIMLDFYKKGKISLEQIVRKMCHAPADCFCIKDRGYIKEGYYADLVLLDLDKSTSISKDNILYKCNWSPLEGLNLPGQIKKTYVNGSLVYNDGKVISNAVGKRLKFKK